MKICVIEHDPSFASIAAVETSSSTQVYDLTADIIHEFKSPTFTLLNSDKDRANFYYLNDTALIFDQTAYNAFSHYIEEAGVGGSGPIQLFNIEVDNVGPLYLLNVVAVCNALNKNESTVVPDSWKKTIELNQLFFRSNRIYSHSSLFKIPDLGYRPVLTYTDRGEDGPDFIQSYHEAGLTGLSFRELWSG